MKTAKKLRRMKWLLILLWLAIIPATFGDAIGYATGIFSTPSNPWLAIFLQNLLELGLFEMGAIMILSVFNKEIKRSMDEENED